MSHRQTQACRAGGLHHGRPNVKGRDTSEQRGVMLTSIPRERENPRTGDHTASFHRHGQQTGRALCHAT